MKPEVIDKLRVLGLKTYQIAWGFSVSERTVQRWGKPVSTAKGRRGRPPVLDETHAQQILDVLKEKPDSTLSQITGHLSAGCHLQLLACQSALQLLALEQLSLQ